METRGKKGGDSMAEVVVSRNTFLMGLVVAIIASTLLSTTISSQLIAVGPQGPKGDQGDHGIAGSQGDQGSTGLKGDTGDTGPQGEEGSMGPQGVSLWENSSITISPRDFIGAIYENFTYVKAVSEPRWAVVRLPHGVLVTNMTVFAVDTKNIDHVEIELRGFNLTNMTLFGPMAHVETWDFFSSGDIVLVDTTIENGLLDNQSCIHTLKLFSVTGDDYLGIKGVIISYEYHR
jgi:hypothetical protein